jgi:hypothetical protein
MMIDDDRPSLLPANRPSARPSCHRGPIIGSYSQCVAPLEDEPSLKKSNKIGSIFCEKWI